MKYKIAVSMTGPSILGQVILDFTLSTKSEKLFLDSTVNKVKFLKINGLYVVHPKIYSSGRIFIPEHLQIVGRNVV